MGLACSCSYSKQYTDTISNISRVWYVPTSGSLCCRVHLSVEQTGFISRFLGVFFLKTDSRARGLSLDRPLVHAFTQTSPDSWCSHFCPVDSQALGARPTLFFKLIIQFLALYQHAATSQFPLWFHRSTEKLVHILFYLVFLIIASWGFERMLKQSLKVYLSIFAFAYGFYIK